MVSTLPYPLGISTRPRQVEQVSQERDGAALHPLAHPHPRVTGCRGTVTPAALPSRPGVAIWALETSQAWESGGKKKTRLCEGHRAVAVPNPPRLSGASARTLVLVPALG